MITFDDLVTILKATKKDSWGISVFSDAAEVVACKIFYSLKHEELKNIQGETVKVTGKIYFEGLYPIEFTDKLSFTDDFGVSYELPILEIKAIKDFSNEIQYTKVVV